MICSKCSTEFGDWICGCMWKERALCAEAQLRHLAMMAFSAKDSVEKIIALSNIQKMLKDNDSEQRTDEK